MRESYTIRAARIREKLPHGAKIAFVSGYFNVLHPGHLRLLYYASEQADHFVVGLIAKPEKQPSSTLADEVRKNALSAISCVDDVVILTDGLEGFLKELKPEIVILGSEHRGENRPEENILRSYGGRVIFSSGEMASVLLENGSLTTGKPRSMATEKQLEYCKRHKITKAQLKKVVGNFPKLNLWVIGDTIIDEYTLCDAVGMSREDPTIVVRPVKSNLFLGGAGIVAGHARSLGANVTFATVTGNDEMANYAERRLEELKITSHVYRDDSRKTTHKQRYRAETKTMLRVNNFTESAVDTVHQNNIVEAFKAQAKDIDAVIFSDFNYGILPQPMVERITEIAAGNDVLVVADSQTSSQLGDISRFKGAKLLTPTETEARVGVHNSEDGIVTVAEQLRQKTDASHIFVTLGAEGMLIHTSDVPEGSQEKWNNDRLRAMNTAPRDPAGAGDAMLVMSTLALASAATIWQAAYLGSIASACQVGRVGNIPLVLEEILLEIGYQE